MKTGALLSEEIGTFCIGNFEIFPDWRGQDSSGLTKSGLFQTGVFETLPG